MKDNYDNENQNQINQTPNITNQNHSANTTTQANASYQSPQAAPTTQTNTSHQNHQTSLTTQNPKNPKSQKKLKFVPMIFVPSVALIVLLVALSVSMPRRTSEYLSALRAMVFERFSWLFILSVSFFVVFMILLALSKFGDIKLGKDDDEPRFSFFAWLSMLFATGMGVGLMYFGAAEPLIHQKSLNATHQEAIIHTLFHWGIHPWAIYGVCALAMAYFGFRYRMPLTLRSAFYPFLKQRIYGAWGHLIDALALVVTVFGISTTLGYSASSLNAGLLKLGFVDEMGFYQQCIIVIVSVVLATMSAISGLSKGLKFLSELNLALAFLLMIFVLFSGDVVRLLSYFSSNIGLYFSHIVELSYKTYMYEPHHLSWFNSWTIFYWAWWLSWAPFVGFFIAKISKGRTIREFVFGVLFVPTLFNILWFSIFGNHALSLSAQLSSFTSTPERVLFEFLDILPFSSISGVVALVVLLLFFITSTDSGIFVLCSLSSGGKDTKTKSQSIMWGAMLVIVALSLSYAGGLDGILSVVMIVALPFCIMLVLCCASLLRGLAVDSRYFGAKMSAASVYWSGDFWQDRLEAILAQRTLEQSRRFMHSVVLDAMRATKDRLDMHGICSRIDIDSDKITLTIAKDLSKDFIYGARIRKHERSDTLLDEPALPNLSSRTEYKIMSFFGDDRPGYDIGCLSTKEIIVDIIKQYERYLSLLDDSANDIFTMDA